MTRMYMWIKAVLLSRAHTVCIKAGGGFPPEHCNALEPMWTYMFNSVSCVVIQVLNKFYLPLLLYGEGGELWGDIG